MKIDQQQHEFLARRRRLVKLWRYVGPLMLLVIVGLVWFLTTSTPLMINPFEIISRLESGAVDQPTLEMMAVLLPVTFILVCFLLAVFVALMYMAFSNEKKYLEILEANQCEQ